MNLHEIRRQLEQDPVTKKVLDVGFPQYFSGITPTTIGEVKDTLSKTAQKLEAFLNGEGKGTALSETLTTVEVDALRSCAAAVDPKAKMIGADLIVLVAICVEGGASVAANPLDRSLPQRFLDGVKGFVEQNTLRDLQ